MGANKKRKAAATVGAVTLVAALVLTGTYAWNSISQKAKNENTVYANPGGRLHDDWNGSDPKNGIKRVYVENFTKETYTDVKDGTVQNDPNAAPIYVRVKLQTYMEYGEEAGKVDGSGAPVTGRNAKPLVTGSDMGDTDTWPVYIKGQSSAFQSYFDLETKLNEKLKYIPTFNKNKESLLVDINGTYEGTATGDTTYFDDFKDYGTSTTPGADGTAAQTADAYYYLKGGTAAENAIPGDETEHVKNKQENHAVAETLETDKIITMEEWLGYDGTTSGQEKTGNYWIYDEDGWAYWAEPLEPGTATGPLLTDVKMKNSLGGNCYYAINVTGEFASAGDWGKENGGTDKELGFYKNGITDNALNLLNTMAKTVGADWVNITATSEGANADTTTNSISVDPGATVNFTGEVTLMGDKVSEQGITWALDTTSRATSATLEQTGNNATLTIPSNLPAQTIKVMATPKANPKAVVTYKVKVAGPDTVKITNDVKKIKPGETLTLTAEVKKNGTSGNPQNYVNQDVEWSVSGYANGSTVITPGTNTLSVSASENLGNTLTVTAKSVIDNKVLAEKEIYVTNNTVLPIDTLKTVNSVKVTEDGVLEGTNAGPNNSILGNANNTQTIVIDGVPFFVIAKKDGKALLLTEKKYKETMFFNGAVDATTVEANKNHWKDSTIRAWLNSTEETYVPVKADGTPDSDRTYTGATAGWLNGKTDLAKAAIPTQLKTLQEFDDIVTDDSKIDTTTDKIFFLSEADVFGSTGNTVESGAPASFYTVTKTDGGAEKGVKLVAPNGTWIPQNASDTTTSHKWWWLRSPRNSARSVAIIYNVDTLGYAIYSYTDVGVRPACWIDI